MGLRRNSQPIRFNFGPGLCHATLIQLQMLHLHPCRHCDHPYSVLLRLIFASTIHRRGHLPVFLATQHFHRPASAHHILLLLHSLHILRSTPPLAFMVVLDRTQFQSYLQFEFTCINYPHCIIIISVLASKHPYRETTFQTFFRICVRLISNRLCISMPHSGRFQKEQRGKEDPVVAPYSGTCTITQVPVGLTCKINRSPNTFGDFFWRFWHI